MEALYLNAKNQTALEQALINASVAKFIDQDFTTVQEDGTEVITTQSVLVPVEGYSIDVIGTYKKGYLCNLIGELTDEQKALLPIIPEPVSPNRVFGGWWTDPSLIEVTNAVI